MTEMINHDNVAMVLRQNGKRYEVDRGTFSSIPEANFLSGHTRTKAFGWETHGAGFACPCSALVPARYSM
jgi:hypothetical protein